MSIYKSQKQYTLNEINSKTERKNTLRLIINHYLEPNDYSLEYLLVEEWIRRFKEAEKDFFIASQKKYYFDLKESLYWWLFFLKKKIKTKKQIAAQPQTKIWLLNIIFSLILAISISHFTPDLARAITAPADKITAYPIVKIIQFVNNNSVAKQKNQIKKYKQTVNQKILTTFIKKHHQNFQLNGQPKQTYVITAEELFGQVAGAQEKIQPSTTLLKLSIKEASANKESGGVGGFLKSVVRKMGEKQVELSEKLNQKLQEYFRPLTE